MTPSVPRVPGYTTLGHFAVESLCTMSLLAIAPPKLAISSPKLVGTLLKRIFRYFFSLHKSHFCKNHLPYTTHRGDMGRSASLSRLLNLTVSSNDLRRTCELPWLSDTFCALSVPSARYSFSAFHRSNRLTISKMMTEMHATMT